MPGSVLLEIEAEPSLAKPDELRLTVLGAGGVEVKERRLPEAGKPTLPSSVVLYPRRAGGLRILVRALAAGARVGEGATLAEARDGAQVGARVTLRAAALPDRDGDGLPDVVDNCPDQANPEQATCPKEAGVSEGTARDAVADRERTDGQKRDRFAVDRKPLDDGRPRDGTGRDAAKTPDLATDLKKKLDAPKPPDLKKPDAPKPDLFKLPDLPQNKVDQKISPCPPQPCDLSSGNVVILSCYTPGTWNIVVDVSIPGLKVGIVAYDPGLNVTFSGPYVNQVAAVHYAGFNDGTISGVPNSIVSRRCTTCSGGLAAATCTDPLGWSQVVCATKCENGTSNGGCNSQGQIELYMLSKFAANATLRWHNMKYSGYPATISLAKARTSCCGNVY